jgi:Cu(I)/Ag(I) efflux system membrane fusion protein
MQSALSADDPITTAQFLQGSREALELVEAGGLPEDAAERWQELAVELRISLEHGADASDIALLRRIFEEFSKSMLALEASFRHPGEQIHQEVFCSMAFDDGASWLQIGEEVSNPYYGSGMLRCGELRMSYPGLGMQKDEGR